MKKGKNIVVVDFCQKYVTNGFGLSSVTESYEDGTQDQYLFSWNETYGCRHTFPNFDQPNIRGQIKLFIAAPNKWVCSSNERKKGMVPYVDYQNPSKFMKNAHKRLYSEVSAGDVPDFSIREFLTTKAISSYLFALNAGPYKQIKSDLTHGEVKMAIYVTKTQYEDCVKVSHLIFEATLFGLKKCETIFGMPYQYSKYDYTFPPTLSIGFGACEKPGNVVTDSIYLEDNRRIITSAILWIVWHEMVHMWYGDLVTIEWWGETWLKEAMADYIPNIIYKEFSNADPVYKNLYLSQEQYFSNRKLNGMVVDMHPMTTRSIDTTIDLSENAHLIYNRIIYGKSPAVVHEIFNMLGGKDFLSYFSHHYLETNKNDSMNKEKFVTAIEKTLKKNSKSIPKVIQDGKLFELPVRDIIDHHFYHGGVDHLDFDVDYENKVIKITQTPANKDLYRRHYFDIGFLSAEGKLVHNVTVYLPNTATHEVPLDFDGEFVQIIPNYSNFGYFYFEFNEEGRTYFMENLANLDDQSLIIFNQYEYIRTCKGSLLIDEYLDWATDLMTKRTDSFLPMMIMNLTTLLGYSSGTLNKHIKFKVYNALKPLLLTWPTNDMTVLENLLKFAPSKKDVRDVFNWMFKHETFKPLRENLSVNAVKRWADILCFHHQIEEADKQLLLDLLKTKSYHAYNDLLARKEVENMGKEQLRELWEQYCRKATKENDSHRQRQMKKAFLKNIEKCEFEGGWPREFFKRLPQYMQGHDWYSCSHFMEMMPAENKAKCVKKLNKVLDNYVLLYDEVALINAKLADLHMKMHIEKANS